MKKMMTSRFDIEGNSFLRVFILSMMNKFIPLGNFKQGPGLKDGLVLLALNYLGKPLFKLGVRNEQRLTRLYLRLKPKK